MMAMTADETWFLAQLKPNAARVARENLTRQGFRTFLPTEARTHSRNGKFVTSPQPLFPGYIFVAFDVSLGLWRKVNATRGITRLVSLASVPTPVPTAVVAGLLARCDDAGLMRPTSDFDVGDAVTVTAGPFADFVAEVQSIDVDQRIWVLMEIMGRQTKAAVSPDRLRKV